jgi:hypothetical protein
MFQSGTGATAGFLAQPGIEFGARGIAALANAVSSRARGAVADTSSDAAVKYATTTLAAQGIKFNELGEQVQKSIVKDVQDALKKYGGVNASALARQSDFKEIGVDPLKPWVTRDPVEWGQYKNLEPAKDAGEPLIRAKSELTEKLFNRIESHRGVPTGDHYQSGQIAEKVLTKAHKQASENVDGLYDKFRKLAPTTAADPKRFSEDVLAKLDEAMAHEPLPENLRNAVNKIAKGEMPATPQVLFQLQKAANRAARSGGDSGYAAGIVAKAVDTELDQFANDLSAVGPQMRQAYDTLRAARAAHRSLKVQEEAIPALKAVAEGKFAAEDFFNSYVKSADVKEVAAMWSGVESAEMKQAVRSQLIDHLKKSAEGQDFQHKAFKNVLESPGMPQKIQIILGERGLADVQRVQRSAENAIKTPAGARYNTSGSAMELANLLKRGSGLPVVGPMVSEPLQKMLAQAQASGMGKSGIGQGLLDPFYEELLRKSRRGAGLLSPAIGLGTAGELTR